MCGEGGGGAKRDILYAVGQSVHCALLVGSSGLIPVQ